MSDPLPCPFCGGAAETICSVVNCSNPRCICFSIQAMPKEWNTRAPDYERRGHDTPTTRLSAGVTGPSTQPEVRDGWHPDSDPS